MQDWIDINEKLPKYNQTVLLYGNSTIPKQEFGEFEKLLAVGFLKYSDIQGEHWILFNTDRRFIQGCGGVEKWTLLKPPKE